MNAVALPLLRPALWAPLLFFAAGLFAQEPPKKWKLADLSLWAGTSFGEAPTGLGDFREYLRDTSLLAAPPLDNFAPGCTPYCYLFDAPAIYVGFGVGRNQLSADGKTYGDRSEWRIGGGVQFRSQVLGFHRETPMSGDTLGFTAVSYRLLQFEPSFESSWLFLTDPKRKVIAYGGGGFRIGVPLVTRVDEVVQQGTSLVTENRPYRYIYAVDETYQGLRTRQPVFVRLYLPVGLRFRLAANLQLCLELHAGFSYRHLFPGGGTPSYYLAGQLGIRSKLKR
jgi:hypothetical protein